MTHLHPTAGTIFARSSTSMHLWFYAMHLITSTRCGISAKHRERELQTIEGFFGLFKTGVRSAPPCDFEEVARELE